MSDEEFLCALATVFNTSVSVLCNHYIQCRIGNWETDFSAWACIYRDASENIIPKSSEAFQVKEPSWDCPMMDDDRRTETSQDERSVLLQFDSDSSDGEDEIQEWPYQFHDNKDQSKPDVTERGSAQQHDTSLVESAEVTDMATAKEVDEFAFDEAMFHDVDFNFEERQRQLPTISPAKKSRRTKKKRRMASSTVTTTENGKSPGLVTPERPKNKRKSKKTRTKQQDKDDTPPFQDQPQRLQKRRRSKKQQHKGQSESERSKII